MGEPCNSSSSSIDSSSHPSLSTSTFLCQTKRDLSTDLRLGLSISTSQQEYSSTLRDQHSDWPPIKPLTESGNRPPKQPTFFVKVYMEGIPIGRKLDLFAHKGYPSLIRSLRPMFGTTILCPDIDQVASSEIHVLTYEDQEGDWMMVGDVPWEMFLTTVKRLKITRASNC